MTANTVIYIEPDLIARNHIVQPNSAPVAADSRHRTEIDGLAPEATATCPERGPPPLFIERVPGALDEIGEFLDWAEARRELLDHLILQYGGIVLRGFPLASAEDFDRFVRLFPAYDRGYVAGMTPRNFVAGKVMESTRLAADYKIGLHSEMAYMRTYPPRIAFFARKAAGVGGETIIGSLREITRRLPKPLRARLEAHKVHMVRNYAPCGNTRDAAVVEHADQMGWDDAFHTESRSDVEAQCRAIGLDFTWNADASLTVVDTLDPFTDHPKTGERFFRSNVHTNKAADRQGYGDIRTRVQASQKRRSGHFLDNGEELSPDECETIHRILEEVEISWKWQDGDVMILDNLQVAHGRNPFSGPREILVALLGEPD